MFGIAAIVVMLCSFDMEYDELLANLRRAGMWLPAVVGLWIIIYLFNTLSWYIIIRDGKKGTPIPFWKVYKLTVSGFALNYATPVGLMGGEPYRIMELTPYVGASKATSSVILYVMMHIFSHFCFWFFSIFLYLALRPVDIAMGTILAVVGAVSLLAIYFFMKGYKNGMAVRTLKLLQHIPFIKEWAKRFSENKREALERVDSQIAELHKQRRSTFYASLSLEFMARIIGCLEVYFILNILTTDVSFPACILIMAFTSLFANLFFFSPMQLGAREGGFALAVGGLAIPGAFGVYTGLITRVRELIWIVIGVLLMKVGNGTPAISKIMDTLKNIQGVIFDYGGTIDTNSCHWAEVLWTKYMEHQVPVDKESFREAYVFGERALAKYPFVQPWHNFHDVLSIKTKLQVEWLAEQRKLPMDELQLQSYAVKVADSCYGYVLDILQVTRPVVKELAKKYRLVLVSNFYGNIQTILKDFGLLDFFDEIIESSVVGVRKPDPAIYRLGVDAMGFAAENVLVVGDSFLKDVVPAKAVGCRVAWLKGEGWGGEVIDESVPDVIITDLAQLLALL
jgi:HAD superfamily hydrolase (TIGR01509 family)